MKTIKGLPIVAKEGIWLALCQLVMGGLLLVGWGFGIEGARNVFSVLAFASLTVGVMAASDIEHLRRRASKPAPAYCWLWRLAQCALWAQVLVLVWRGSFWESAALGVGALLYAFERDKVQDLRRDIETAAFDPIVGDDGKAWPETMDGDAWASEFVRRVPSVDRGMALAWFCSALERGRDEGRWAAEAQHQPLQSLAREMHDAWWNGSGHEMRGLFDRLSSVLGGPAPAMQGQPPVDNNHVAPGCELFAGPLVRSTFPGHPIGGAGLHAVADPQAFEASAELAADGAKVPGPGAGQRAPVCGGGHACAGRGGCVGHNGMAAA